MATKRLAWRWFYSPFDNHGGRNQDVTMSIDVHLIASSYSDGLTQQDWLLPIRQHLPLWERNLCSRLYSRR